MIKIIRIILLYISLSKMKTTFPIVSNVFGEKSILTDYPRGIRNNNCGNLVKTPIAWKGKIKHSQNTDSRFEQFETFEHGLRAMMKDLKSDIKKGLYNLKLLIHEYAPPHENDTMNYINYLAKELNIGVTDPLTTDLSSLYKIAKVISSFENGKDVVTIKHYKRVVEIW